LSSLKTCFSLNLSPFLTSFNSSINTPQLFSQDIFSKVLLLSLLRNLVITRAPCENNLSLAVEEAGIPKYFRAIKARQGNLEALDF
jgi:hypothetical protein